MTLMLIDVIFQVITMFSIIERVNEEGVYLYF